MNGHLTKINTTIKEKKNDELDKIESSNFFFKFLYKYITLFI